MRPPNKNRNNRNKSGRKPMGNVSSRVYESAGPEGKVRGTPQQIIEKYLNMARDAQTSGDRVMSENFLQHAEHYIRLLSAAQQQLDDRRTPGQPGGSRDGDDGGRDEDDFEGYADRFTQPERVTPSQEERAAPPTNGATQSTDPRDQDRPRREHGHERNRDARDQDRPRREGGEDRPRREGGEDRPRREGGEDRPRRDRNDARPRREAAALSDARPQTADPSTHGAGALETIDSVDDASVGPVATPENVTPVKVVPESGAPENAAPENAAPESAAPESAEPDGDSTAVAAEKPAEPRRRRRRAPAAEAAPSDAAPAVSEQAVAAAEPGQPD